MTREASLVCIVPAARRAGVVGAIMRLSALDVRAAWGLPLTLRYTAAALAQAAATESVVERLFEQILYQAGRRSSPAEVRSWKRSLPVLVQDLVDAVAASSAASSKAAVSRATAAASSAASAKAASRVAAASSAASHLPQQPPIARPDTARAFLPVRMLTAPAVPVTAPVTYRAQSPSPPPTRTDWTATMKDSGARG